MAKLTKTQIQKNVAEGAGISKKQAEAALETLAGMAYANAGDGFTIPGIGKVTKRQTKERTMTMAFGPKAGQEITVPAKTKLKFTFVKAAKDAILG